MVTKSGYRKQGEHSGEGYRLDKTEFVQKGRRRELLRTTGLMLALYSMQLLLFLTATGGIESVADLGPVVPGRLSLLVDLACILAQLFVAYRAWGLVRSRRCAPHWLLLSQCAVASVVAGSLLDLVGDIRLWFLVDSKPAEASLTLTFDQVLWRESASTGIPWYSLLVTMLTVAGVSTLLLQAVMVEVTNRENQPPLSAPGKDTRDGPIICCSGGGIRATAFSLGGLQVLHREGIYQNAAAVVGVSGGGYIAAAQHILRWNVAEDGSSSERTWHLEPPGMPPFALDSPETQWLRRHTRYVLDSLGAFTRGALSLAFGIAVNLLLVVVAIGSAAWLLAWLFLASGRLHMWHDQIPHAGIGGPWAPQWAWVPLAVYAVPILGIALFVLEKCIDRFGTPWAWLGKFLRTASQSLIVAGAVLIVLVRVVPWIVEALSEYTVASDSPFATLLHQAGLVPNAVCNKNLDISGVGCGLNRSDKATQSTLAGPVSLFAVVSSILAVLASAKSAATSKDAGLGSMRGFLVKVWDKVKDPLIPYLAATIIVVVGVCFFLREVTRLVVEPDMLTAWNKALVVAALLIFARVFTDANRTSMHYFFRERISDAFFVRRTESSVRPIDYKHPLRFSQAKPLDGGPHLISCAVANVSDQELVPSERGCTPFIFGHSRIGLTDGLLPEGAARRVSSVYEFAADDFYRDATIPAAVAISAAAFSPLAGRENVRVGPYRLVLALGNARLGVWLPNPIWIDETLLLKRMLRLNQLHEAARVWAPLDEKERDRLRLPKETQAMLDHIALTGDLPQKPDEVRSLRWYRFTSAVRGIFKKPGLSSLIKEAIGKASIYDRFLYITDGGHYDNLGLVEALRRRPTKIYVLDASNDPEDTFRALGRAIATARMDLDCDLVMDPRGMRRLAQTRSGSAWCVGKYSYDSGHTGNVYLAKAVLPEGLPWDIETYALDNKDFPRTSTGKQLYSEFDFEAYRELGSNAVRALLVSKEYSDSRQESDQPG